MFTLTFPGSVLLSRPMIAFAVVRMRWWLAAGLGVGIVMMTAQGVTLGARQIQSVWDSIYTDDQANRGEVLYRAACESCHAPDLSGGKVVPELIGKTFTEDWNGLTVGQLFDRVLLSMPEGDPASVSRTEKADILAFILRANGFPSGDLDLEARTEFLDRFRFDAVAP